MKTDVAHIDSHSYGAEKTQAFQISENAQMFKILSSKLYTDKPLAVVRELSANAYDAHVVAGNSAKPFYIHCPTQYEPYFLIRDYGTGLSQSGIFELYSVYGASDKRKSNNLIGGMGIGSKSPFAYANTFEVNSYYQGTKLIFASQMDTRGIPKIQKFGETETTEPNGLEIKVDVKQEDIGDFNRAIAKTFKHYKVKPDGNFRNASVFIQDVATPLWKGTGWGVSGSGNSCVVMGSIEYPIEAYHFEPKASSNAKWYAQTSSHHADANAKLLSLGITMHFDIGEVQMSASREGLEYTDITKDAIKERLRIIKDELVKVVEDEINACSNLYEARKCYDKMQKTNVQQLLSLKKFTFNGQSIDFQFDLSKFSEAFTISAGGRVTKHKAHNVRYDAKFYENDLLKGTYVRLGQVGGGNIVLMKFKDAVERADFFKLLGTNDESLLVKTSTLPKPVYEKRERETGVYNLNSTDPIDFEDIDDDCLYVELNRNKYINGEYVFQFGDAEQILNLMKTLNITVPKIYEVKTAQIKRFCKTVNATQFATFVKKQIDDYIKANKIDDAVKACKLYTNNQNLHSYLCGLFSAKVPACAKNRPYEVYLELCQAHAEYAKSAKKIDQIRKCGIIGVQLSEVEVSSYYLSDLVSGYPMLTLLSNHNIGEKANSKTIVEYMDSVDAAKKP